MKTLIFDHSFKGKTFIDLTSYLNEPLKLAQSIAKGKYKGKSIVISLDTVKALEVIHLECLDGIVFSSDIKGDNMTNDKRIQIFRNELNKFYDKLCNRYECPATYD